MYYDTLGIHGRLGNVQEAIQLVREKHWYLDKILTGDISVLPVVHKLKVQASFKTFTFIVQVFSPRHQFFSKALPKKEVHR